MQRKYIAAIGVALILGVGGMVVAQQTGHGSGAMHSHGAGGMMAHDEVTMPGLKGKNASAEESEELAIMFRNFQTLSREVENLPNGIRTRTASSDAEVHDVLVSHVVGMIDRVEMGEDPKVFIQSPTLDIFFQRHDAITTDIDIRDDGIFVTQTSEDPEIVEALQTHAAEVTAMAEGGMQAVHEMMEQRAGN